MVIVALAKVAEYSAPVFTSSSQLGSAAKPMPNNNVIDNIYLGNAYNAANYDILKEMDIELNLGISLLVYSIISETIRIDGSGG